MTTGASGGGGNHEMYRDTVNWVRRFEAEGMTVLKNQSVPLTRDGATITLVGGHDCSDEGQFLPDYDAALRRVDPRGSR